MKPEISVVIPLYNKEKYIQRTLDSVLNQTFRNFECIIVDSSNDGSTDIVRKCTDSRVRHIIRENRTYLPIARNMGVSHSRTALIAFIDADDEWTPDHLAALTSLSSHYPHAGLFATSYIKLRADGSPMTMIFAGISQPPWEGELLRYFRICSRGDVPVSSSSCAIRKEVFDEAGGFNEDLIYGGEDQHLWGRVALRYPVAFTWKGPAIYHTEADARMCNDPHPFIGDPLSKHLKVLMAQGSIAPDLVKDVNAYIRRRQITVWVSRLLGRTVLRSDGISGNTQSVKSFGRSMFAPLVLLFAHTIGTFLNSRCYDTCRKLWCHLHGWHIARLE